MIYCPIAMLLAMYSWEPSDSRLTAALLTLPDTIAVLSGDKWYGSRLLTDLSFTGEKLCSTGLCPEVLTGCWASAAVSAAFFVFLVVVFAILNYFGK